MDIHYLSPYSINPYSKNAKLHPKEQIDKIAASIQNFGFNQPIVVDVQNVVIVGHGRLEAAKQLNLDEVPVLTLDLTEEQARSYRLADNKLNESDWDMELVIQELRGLSDDLIDLTGFDKSLIQEAEDKEDVVPLVPIEPKSKLGDIIELGDHRLMCGDSTSVEDVAALMVGTTADMVFTDPPYNVNYAGRGENTSKGILNDSMSEGAFDTFLEAIFARMAEHTKAGAGWYVFHSTSTQAQFEAALKKQGLAIRNQLIWNKPTASMGWGDYRWKHEPFFYCSKEGVDTVFYGDRTHSTIVDFQKSEEELLRWAKRMKAAEKDGKTTIWTMKREPVGDYVHPTQKPVELIQYALENSSKSGDVVMDLFGGSGSTMIACEKLGRRCFSMELDPAFVDTIIKRWVDYTGNPFVKVNGLEVEWE